MSTDLTSVATILSALAVLVAALALYFNALRGPRITLHEYPDFQMLLVPKLLADQAHEVPNKLIFKSYLIFTNEGTRSSAITFSGTFIPRKELEEFIVKKSIEVSVSSSSSSESAPNYFTIRERESKVFEIRLEIELDDWKSYFAQDNVERDDIASSLLAVPIKSRKRLSEFCELIRGNSQTSSSHKKQHTKRSTDLGVVELVSQQSLTRYKVKNTWGERNYGTKTIYVNSEELLDIFEYYGVLWEDLPDPITSSLRAFDTKLDDIQRTINYYETLLDRDHALGDDLLATWYADELADPYRALREKIKLFLTGSSNLGLLLFNLQVHVRDYNKEQSTAREEARRIDPTLAYSKLQPSKEAVRRAIREANDEITFLRDVIRNYLKQTQDFFL